jgi:hypothetical protein
MNKFAVTMTAGVLGACIQNFAAVGPTVTSFADYCRNSYRVDQPTKKVSAVLVNKNGSTTYKLNGSTVSASKFLSEAENYEKNDKSRNNYTQPKVIRNKTNYTLNKNKYKYNAVPDKGSHVSGGYKVDNVFYTDVGSLKSAIGLGYGDVWNHGGKGVSVLLMGEGIPMLHYSNNVISGGLGNSQYRQLEARWDFNRYGQLLNRIAPDACYTGFDVMKSHEQGYRPLYPTGIQNNPKSVDGEVCGPYYVGAHIYTNTSYAEYNSYSDEAAVLDDFIYNTRIIQFASAGEGNNPNSAAFATNAITVGGVDRRTDNAGDYYWRNAIYGRNGAQIVKPEILGFNHIYLSGEKTYESVNAKTGMKEYVSHPTTGSKNTAAATIFMAGMAADLVAAQPFYKWHPEVVKALMITASVYEIKNPRYDSDNIDKPVASVGTKIPQFRNMMEENVSRYWLGEHNDHFVNNKIEFYEDGIEKNQKYRIAISWLNRGDCSIMGNVLQQNMTLTVTAYDQNGKKSNVYTSTLDNSGYQVVEFTAPVSGNYKVEITRSDRGYNKTERVILGYNCHKIQW